MSDASARQRREIERSLREASDEQLVRVMRFIDRLPSRAEVDDLVEAIRGRLAAVRPGRPMSPCRVLVLPFEDLLADPRHVAGSSRLVPRPLLGIVSRLVFGLSPPDLVRDWDRACEGKTMSDRAAVAALGAAMWPVAARTLRSERSLAAARAERAWSPDHESRLAGIAVVLDHAIDVLDGLEALPPKPMGRLREDEEGAALGFLQTAWEADPVLFDRCYAMLTRRSSEPSSVFRLLLDYDLGLPTEERDQIIREAAVDCLAEIDAINERVDLGADRSVVNHAENATRLVGLIESLEAAPSAAGVDGRQLAATKAKASTVIVRTFQSTIDGEMRRTLAQIAGSDEISDDEIAAAESIARSTRKVEIAGAKLGLGGALSAVLNREFGAYRGLLRAKLDATDGSPAMRAAAVMDELRLIEIVFGADAALDLLGELRGERGRSD